MKKFITLGIIAMFALAPLSQAVYAHDSGGDQENDNHFSFGSNVSLGTEFRSFFNRFHNNDNEKLEANDNDNEQGENDENDNDEATSTIRENHQESVRGLAKVTAISGNTITAVATIGENQKTFTITTDSNTTFTNRLGGGTLLANIGVGDLIGFNGTLTSHNGSSYSLTASKIRVWGDVDLNARVTATGTISSIDASSSQFVISNASGTILVSATDLTKFRDASNTPSTFANLAVGMSVKIKGFWNSLMNIITAFKVRVF
jgi:hypothetical protein